MFWEIFVAAFRFLSFFFYDWVNVLSVSLRRPLSPKDLALLTDPAVKVDYMCLRK